MSEVIPFKKTVNERLKERLGERDEAIKAVIKNEAITRKRVEAVEYFAEATSKNSKVVSDLLVTHHGVLSRSFLGRMRWLILGR